MLRIKKAIAQEPAKSGIALAKPHTYEILKAQSGGERVQFVNIEYSPANGLHQSNDGGQTVPHFSFDVRFESGRIKPGDELRQQEWAMVYMLFKYSLVTGFKNNQCFSFK